MTQRTRMLVHGYLALALSALVLPACNSADPANKLPTAVITVMLDGQVLAPTSPVPFMDQPVTVTLDGSHSTDADGSIIAYLWKRTDVPATLRFGIMPPAGAGGAPAAGSGGAPAGSGGAPAGSGGAPAGSGGAAADEDGGVVAGTGGMAAPAGSGGAAAPAPAPMMMGSGGKPAPKVPAFTSDPAPGAMTQVVLTEKGNYRFSLWVQDNDHAYSKAASVTLKVGGFAPNPACAAVYKTPKMDCQACTCTPNAMGGCQTEADRCLNNADPTFKMLCTAVVDCAVAKACSGAACYTGGCMAQIDAAAMYMGGTLGTCSMPAMADANPCAAAGTISACQMSTTGRCADACK